MGQGTFLDTQCTYVNGRTLSSREPHIPHIVFASEDVQLTCSDSKMLSLSCLQNCAIHRSIRAVFLNHCAAATKLHGEILSGVCSTNYPI